MNRADAEQVLLTGGWLSRLPPTLQNSILRRARLLNFKSDEFVYRIGDISGGVYGIADGAFGMEVGIAHSAPRLAHVVRTYMWFGTGPVLSGTPRVVSFRALQSSFVLNVPIIAIQELGAKSDLFWRYLGKMSEEHMRLGIHGVTDLQLTASDRRIAAVLLRVAGVTVEHPIRAPFYVPVGQKELGDMANASRAVVSRVLGRLERQKWIKLGYNRIEILEPTSLTAFAYADGF